MMNKKTKVIAIDGPAASGKSTVATLVAEKLEIPYINTGNMYRAVTFYFLKNNIEFEVLPEDRLTEVINEIDLEYIASDNEDGFSLTLNGMILGDEIRSPEVANKVAEVAKIALVRNAMTQLQRSYAQSQLVVMEGRDIGSVVFPNALYKFFVTASPLVRAQRRLNQSGETTSNATVESVAADIAQRDKLDSERKIAPLVQASDAILVNTSDLTIGEVVEKIISFILIEK